MFASSPCSRRPCSSPLARSPRRNGAIPTIPLAAILTTRRAAGRARREITVAAKPTGATPLPPQEAPRQFYWPWEDRPQQVQPTPAPVPSARPTRPRPPTIGESQRSYTRRPRPAPVVAQPKPVQPKAEPSIRIAVFGDSLANSLGRGLDDVFEDNADVAILDRSKADSGLVRKDVVDWPKAAEDFLKTSPKVAYAVVMLGANDRPADPGGDRDRGTGNGTLARDLPRPRSMPWPRSSPPKRSPSSGSARRRCAASR